MDLLLKSILSLITVFFFIYNFIVVVATLSPTLTGILRTWEFRLPRGYNLLRFIISIGLACFSGFLCIKLIKIVVTSNYIENTFFNILYPVTWLFGISIATIFVRISQVKSLREQLKIFKHTKDEDLLEPRKIDGSNNPQTVVLHNYQNKINTFNTEVNIDNSTSETKIDNSITNNNLQHSDKLRHPLLKDLSNDELNLMIKSFSGEIIIDKDSLMNLHHLFEGKAKKDKIEIIVVNQTNKLNYRKGIDFLRRIIHVDNILNPFSEKEFSKKETAHFIDSNFVLKSTLGKQKDEIFVNDVYYESLRP